MHVKDNRGSADARRRVGQRLLLPQRDRRGRTLLLEGTCMLPFLPPGKRIRLEPRPPRVGEVLVYETHEGFRAHRLIGRQGETLLTRSDRPGSPIERIDLAQVLGVWTHANERRALALWAPLGRVIARASLWLSTPRRLAALKKARRRFRR